MADLKILLMLIVLPAVRAPIPGVFFWKPRLGLDLSIPTTESTGEVFLPTKDNVKEGLVILIEGYEMGMTVVGLASGLTSANEFPHLNPLSAYFYTNVYRWGLRHLSLLPSWVGGTGGHYCDTHKVWKRRFFYMDEFPPNWYKNIFFWVKKEDWKQEELDFQKFKKHSEPAFGKQYRYPTKKFRDFASFQTQESYEGSSGSGSSSE